MPKKVPPRIERGAAQPTRRRVAVTAKVKGRTDTVKPVTPSVAKGAQRATAETVVLQARVEAQFARTLLDEDAAVLGLDGASAVIREGLRLLHRHAREQAAVAAYDAFYGGAVAPLAAGTASAEAD